MFQIKKKKSICVTLIDFLPLSRASCSCLLYLSPYCNPLAKDLGLQTGGHSRANRSSLSNQVYNSPFTNQDKQNFFRVKHSTPIKFCDLRQAYTFAETSNNCQFWWIHASLPLQRLVTIASFGGFMQAPMNRIKFSWRVFLWKEKRNTVGIQKTKKD